MARTRLRGLSIGGIQFGIEVPETCEWRWPEGPIADFACLPRDPEVHVGLRLGDPDRVELAGECYALGAWTFEVARRGEDWLLGLSRRGRRAQLAHFDSEFRTGEIILSRDEGVRTRYPLRTPLDEWIVLHRTVARGGLCLNARATHDRGLANVRLGAAPAEQADRWMTSTSTLFGRNTVLLREEAGRLRVFRTPWGDTLDARLGAAPGVCELSASEEAERPYRELLDPSEAADLLVTHAIVPLCDDGLLDRVLRNAQRIGESVRVLRLGEAKTAGSLMAWQSPQLQAAFAPPRAML